MGFYIRKSIKVGPLRFNLSRSGIGVSAGIPGFRVGTGPRGNYVHMGTGGLYYRATLPSGSGRQAPPSIVPAYNQPTTHAPLEAIGSGSVSQMRDSSSASLLTELNEKNRRMRRWPLAAVASVGIVCLLLVIGVSPWIVAPVAALAVAGVFYACQCDLLAKSVVIFYEFDSEMQTGYQRIHDGISEFARCGGKWHKIGRAHV